jgi:hypothetical protein
MKKNKEFSFIITGKYEKYKNLGIISDYINDINSSNGNTKAHHIWTENVLNDNNKVYDVIEDVRCSDEILEKIHEMYPDSRVKNVRNADEIYWAVSPKDALGSDRSLVDCHYDAPFSIIPNNHIIFYRVIIACNDNFTVTKSFTNDDIKVTMNTGDFHGLDYNKDWHCVEGQIPPGNYRVLLKLHYLIIPDNYSDDTLFERIVYVLNVYWTYISRQLMRMSAKPQNFIERRVGDSVNISRYTFNNYKPEMYYIFIIIVLIIAFIIHYDKISNYQKKFNVWKLN